MTCHQMETFSALLALYVGNSRVTGEIPHTKASDVEIWFFFDRAWTNSWPNDGDTDDLRCHSAHYDVTVMKEY